MPDACLSREDRSKNMSEQLDKRNFVANNWQNSADESFKSPGEYNIP